MVGKVVTGPWMRLVGRSLNILQMNPYFEEARTKLQEWTTDASPLLHHPPPSVFHDVPIKDDRVLTALQAVMNHHPACLELFQKLCAAVLTVID